MESKHELQVTMPVTIMREDIDDIVCTALEGGITYWCCKAEVVGDRLGEWAHEQISRGGVLKLYDSEESKVYELTLEKLLAGIKKALEQGYYLSDGWFDGQRIDCCQVDAQVADVIVQFALFGEVIYG